MTGEKPRLGIFAYWLALLTLTFGKFPIIFDLDRQGASVHYYLELLFCYHFLGSYHLSLRDNGKAVRASGNEVGNTAEYRLGFIFFIYITISIIVFPVGAELCQKKNFQYFSHFIKRSLFAVPIVDYSLGQGRINPWQSLQNLFGGGVDIYPSPDW